MKSSWPLHFYQLSVVCFLCALKPKQTPHSCTKYLDKGTIKPEIQSHLSVAKHAYISEGSLADVGPYILYRLKTACRRQVTSAFA